VTTSKEELEAGREKGNASELKRSPGRGPGGGRKAK